MKDPGIRVFFFVVGTALLVYTFSNTSSSMEFSKNGGAGTSRKFKGNSYEKSNVDLEDYRHRIDPVPSSKTSIKHGPIEHGTPLNPFIPKPSPPDHPKNDGSST